MQTTLSELLHTVDVSKLEHRDLIAFFAAGCMWAENSLWSPESVAAHAYEIGTCALDGRSHWRLREPHIRPRIAALLAARNGR